MSPQALISRTREPAGNGRTYSCNLSSFLEMAGKPPLAREGYRKTDLNLMDLAEIFSYPGFCRMAARHWRMGMGEVWRSLSRKAFVQALQRLVPDIRDPHLVPSPAGVRAQAVAPDGDLLDDFCIVEGKRMVHILNAPSPAATSALSIGEAVAGK